MMGFATFLKGLGVMATTGIGGWLLTLGLSKAAGRPAEDAIAVGLGLFFLVGSMLLFLVWFRHRL
jgi:hypothetical protein